MYPVSPLPPNTLIRPGSPEALYEEVRKVMDEPVQEDLDYVCNDEELKSLCQHYSVKVDMTKFNCLHHFYEIFKERGSFKKRKYSKKSTLKLLMKAYNHYKDDPRHMYSQEEIEEILRKEWRFRKSWNVYFLKSRRERLAEKNQAQVSDESTTNDVSVVENCSVQEPETIQDSQPPNYAAEFREALEAMGFRQHSTESFDESEIYGSQPGAEDNSLCEIAYEAHQLVESEDPYRMGSHSITSSNPTSQGIASQNTGDYNSFRQGNPQGSTQDSGNNNIKTA